jgi:predicted transcriptional regulator of viral defense system
MLNKPLSRAQREALYKVYRRDTEGERFTQISFRGYRAFRRTARYDTLCDCVMLPWCGMWLGIERDGYTHS